jgi:hypothetical protein
MANALCCTEPCLGGIRRNDPLSRTDDDEITKKSNRHVMEVQQGRIARYSYKRFDDIVYVDLCINLSINGPLY